MKHNPLFVDPYASLPEESKCKLTAMVPIPVAGFIRGLRFSQKGTVQTTINIIINHLYHDLKRSGFTGDFSDWERFESYLLNRFPPPVTPPQPPSGEPDRRGTPPADTNPPGQPKQSSNSPSNPKGRVNKDSASGKSKGGK